SAPGPDGYTSEFYRAAWSVVGQDLFKAVGEFFHTGKLLKQINTLIALIPKRIHRILPLMIDNSQNAFVPGRSITDNILLAQELLAGYNQMRLPNRCTLKVDIQKAYDSVEWDFLLEVLRTENKSSKEPDYFIPISAAGTATDTGLLGFQEGTLPIKYLGWNHQNLSYAGRLQLIKSVLSTLHMYWASAFILPKGILKILEKKMRRFLWHGSGNAKVAWEQICKPKQEGGLGIRSLMIMNQALMLKQLWRLIQNDGTSIWVEWIQRHRLRQSTIWTFNGATGSWGWKKLLKLRPLLQRGVIYKVRQHLYLWAGRKFAANIIISREHYQQSTRKMSVCGSWSPNVLVYNLKFCIEYGSWHGEGFRFVVDLV
ncbi:UNVERIFIED_CONTAM: hypothetical protein Scaly_3021200, partial [Sesamum calycinum]